MDEQIAQPRVGQILPAAGIRLSGTAIAAGARLDEIREQRPGRAEHRSPQGHAVVRQYSVTGLLGAIAAVEVDEQAAPDLRPIWEILSSGGLDFQVQLSHRCMPTLDRRATVIGPANLVTPYGWDSFPLVDTRRDWMIAEVFSIGDVIYADLRSA